jgi:hypothetical protein
VDPPAGADWLTIVPGQYIYHVTGITGTLTTAGIAPFPNCHDASGNGNDATYTNAGSIFVGGLVPGNKGIARIGGNGDQINGTHPIVDVSVPFTYLEWVEFDAPGPDDIQLGAYADSVVHFTGWNLIVPQGFPHRFFIIGVHNAGGAATVWETANNTVPYDSAPHMLAVTFDPAATPQNNIYLDGMLLAWNVTDQPFFYNGPSAGWHFNIGYSPFITDELAIVPGALTVGQIAALYAAGANFTTYEPAVMALAPYVYYHLDGVSSPATPRQTTLAVTDGITEVMQIPTGFALASGAGPYFYSWQPNLAAASQNPDGSVTTVPIPELILPAGYIITSETLDLQAADQWSGVLVWWDDDIMSGGGGAHPYAYPPGAHLIYQQRTPGP